MGVGRNVAQGEYRCPTVVALVDVSGHVCEEVQLGTGMMSPWSTCPAIEGPAVVSGLD